MSNRKRILAVAALALVALAVGLFPVLFPAKAAVPITGAFTYQAGENLTAGTFAKLNGDGNVAEAQACTAATYIIGVVEANCTIGGMARVAPPGTITTIYMSGTISAGQFIVPTTGGYGIAWVAADANFVRYGAVALTANVDANSAFHSTVRAIVVAGTR